MSTPNHQITKRELIEMLEPFADHDKIAIRASNVLVGYEELSNEDGSQITGTKDIMGSLDLFINKVTPVNGKRTSILIQAYET